jgi:methylated-DNA-[protein]-cysteine S-methyltransferase
MTRECLTEEDLLALLAGDASFDEWREHIAACPACQALWSRQERLEKALDAAPNEIALESLTRTARAKLKEALAQRAKPVASYGMWSRSPVGRLFMAVSERGLCAISFRGTEEDFVRRLEGRGFQPLRADEQTKGAMSQLREYFAGRRQRFDVVVDLAGQTRFQRLVLETTAEVPAGQVVSYGEIARRIGKPRATRAVGAALGQNPIPIVVPCHRVVGSDGGLHGYGGGLDVKEKLRRLEGAPI